MKVFIPVITTNIICYQSVYTLIYICTIQNMYSTLNVSIQYMLKINIHIVNQYISITKVEHEHVFIARVFVNFENLYIKSSINHKTRNKNKIIKNTSLISEF
jgi:hypothetical protein